MQQLDLLNDSYPYVPAFRAVDTSKDAAESIKQSASYIRVKVLTAIIQRKELGATSQELSEVLGMAYESVQPRTSELKKQGKIMDSGMRRASRAEDKKAIVWVSGGACPCCNRSFENLARHMATKHKDYVKREEVA